MFSRKICNIYSVWATSIKKKCLQTCAKCAFRSSSACAKSHLSGPLFSIDIFTQSALGLHCSRMPKRHIFAWCGSYETGPSIYNIACVPSEGSDQSRRKLVRVFTVRLKMFWLPEGCSVKTLIRLRRCTG